MSSGGVLFIPLGPLYHLLFTWGVDHIVLKTTSRSHSTCWWKLQEALFLRENSLFNISSSERLFMRESYTTINHHEESINYLDLLSPHIHAEGACLAWLISACSGFLAQGAYCYPFSDSVGYYYILRGSARLTLKGSSYLSGFPFYSALWTSGVMSFWNPFTRCSVFVCKLLACGELCAILKLIDQVLVGMTVPWICFAWMRDSIHVWPRELQEVTRSGY